MRIHTFLEPPLLPPYLASIAASMSSMAFERSFCRAWISAAKLSFCERGESGNSAVGFRLSYSWLKSHPRALLRQKYVTGCTSAVEINTCTHKKNNDKTKGSKTCMRVSTSSFKFLPRFRPSSFAASSASLASSSACGHKQWMRSH